MSNKIQTVPDGDYTTEVVSLDGYVDSKNRNVVEWKLRIIGGTYDQYVLPKNHYLMTQKAIDFLTGEFDLLGFAIKTSADMEAQKYQIVGKHIRVTVKNNEHGFPVIYIKSLVKGPTPTAGQAPVW